MTSLRGGTGTTTVGRFGSEFMDRLLMEMVER
jgi:hypothetical protein